MTDCWADVTWEPAGNAAAYVLQIASADALSPPHSRAASPQSPRNRPGRRVQRAGGESPGDGGEEGKEGGGGAIRTVDRGPDNRFVARGLSPARRYRLRVRAEGGGGGGGNVVASRWSYPETEIVTEGRLPLRWRRCRARNHWRVAA